MVHKIKSIWSCEPLRIRNNRMMSKAFEMQNVNKKSLRYPFSLWAPLFYLCNLQKSSIMRIILVWTKIKLLKIFACKTLQNSTRLQEECRILYEFFLILCVTGPLGYFGYLFFRLFCVDFFLLFPCLREQSVTQKKMGLGSPYSPQDPWP